MSRQTLGPKVHSFNVLCLALLTGCAGGSRASTTPVQTGTADAPPSMECLPSSTDEDEITERMRFAWLLTEQSFEVSRPQMPRPQARVIEIQDWADGTLQGWLQQKTQLVEAARQELDEAAEETHEQRTMAGGLVGLMYEDVARVLLRVPMPEDLQSEPEIAEAFRDVIDAQALPYLEHARRAYRACALNSRGHSELDRWKTFCAARGDQLPQTHRESRTVGTTVEVIGPD